MSWIIIPQPHPLDKLWSVALDAVQTAEDMFDALGEDYTNEQADEAGEVLTEALAGLWALPARNMSDVLVKLNLADLDGAIRNDCPIRDIMDEATEVLDAGVARGTALMTHKPDLLADPLEGVAL